MVLHTGFAYLTSAESYPCHRMIVNPFTMIP